METNTAGTAGVPKTAQQRKTYEIVSKIAYLIGVQKNVFTREQEPPKMEIFRQLETDKRARIIRHLCMVRTAMEKNFVAIQQRIELEHRTPTSMPDLIPQPSIDQLAKDGVSFIKTSNKFLGDHIIETNRLISERIYNCRSLFPSWINWTYIRDLFIMPNGLTIEGEKAAGQVYYESKKLYPYGVYLNWNPCNEGNILASDQKFLRLLYEWHNQKFTDYTMLYSDKHIRDALFEYIMAAENEKTVVLIDCEHSDPYKLTAAFQWLDAECKQNISSIVLFEDEHTPAEWSIVEQFTDIPVEHSRSEGIGQSGSQPLIAVVNMLSRAYHEFYGKNIGSFIIASNDPGYWKLTSSIPETRSFLIVERGECSSEEKEALTRSKIPFCYVDDSYPDDSEEIKSFLVFRELHQYAGQVVHFNAYEMLDTVLQTANMEMTKKERQDFYNKYIKTMQMVISENGDVTLEFKREEAVTGATTTSES